MHHLTEYRFKSAVLILMVFTACRSANSISVGKKSALERNALAELFQRSNVFSDNFTGFELYDPQADRILYAQNEKRYFTPASNTKLFTFYTSLKILPQKVPGLQYVERGDSLIFWGTGDPSFLRSDLDDGTVYKFLKNSSRKLYFSDENFKDAVLGPGWSWDDYQYAYSAERSPFPMYGNLVRFTMHKVKAIHLVHDSTGLKISPPFFRKYLGQDSSETARSAHLQLSRGVGDNNFHYAPQSDTSTFTVEKPYHYTPQLVTKMLSDTLHEQVHYVHIKKPPHTRTIYSVSADTVYKHMLLPSDNFIAEQLLLTAASELGKPLDTRLVIDKMKRTYLKNMPDEPQWVDGSGLSRYNLFTPRSMVWLLKQIDAEFESDQQLFELLATGGKSGTIQNWYDARDGGPPYVFAKTGTLSNNHCLTGFLITKRGRKLLFSFMNNHYVTSSSVVKKEMEKILWYIHQHY